MGPGQLYGETGPQESKFAVEQRGRRGQNRRSVIDHYITLSGPAQAAIRVERSEFRAFAFPVTSEEEFTARLKALEKEHYDATHHCWAFRLLRDQEVRARSSDAGEPSGSAGKPILSAIESADFHDLGVVVVRWFGGVKLGTGGLGRAYRAAAREALASASPRECFRYERFEVVVPFAAVSTVYRLVDAPHIVLESESFGERNEFRFGVRLSRGESFARTLDEKRLTYRRG